MQIPQPIYDEILDLCKQGDNFASENKFDLAKEKYISALKLLPENHTEWEASTWIYVAIGDVHFKTKNYEKSLKCFINAIQCPKGLGNPFIHLRLGQLYFESGNLEKSADELTRAYMGGGADIFMEDDPKYLDFLETKIHIS